MNKHMNALNETSKSELRVHGRRHTEDDCIKIFMKHRIRVLHNNNTIEVPSKVIVGNKMWGRLDYMRRIMGWVVKKESQDFIGDSKGGYKVSKQKRGASGDKTIAKIESNKLFKRKS